MLHAEELRGFTEVTWRSETIFGRSVMDVSLHWGWGSFLENIYLDD
jgi:hypothetical protein